MIISTIVIGVVMLITLAKTTLDVHKLQLSGYYIDQYFKWYKENPSKWVRPYELLFFIGVLLSTSPVHPALRVLGIALVALHGYFFNLIKAAAPVKKPLVYTPRVKRLLVTCGATLIVSGALACLFAPAAAGLLSVFIYVASPLYIALANGLNKPIEARVNAYYINDAKRHLKENPHLTVIGITGSYGKTSTKNVLYAMLSKDFNVLMTPESYNTTMGVTRTIRSDLKPIHDIFIAEMGAKKTGDIAELCDLTSPSIGVITSIGPQHLDTFKTFENIVRTKGELFAHLEPGGTAFVNASDPNILSLPKRDDLSYVHFTADSDLEGYAVTPDYSIEAVSIGAGGSSFTLVHAPTDKRVRLSTKLLGRHNLLNIVTGAAIALSLGIKMERLNTLIADLKPVKHRLSSRRVGDTYTVLDDAFNSNPVGSKMALEVLKAYEGNKKIVITPGMIELGDRFYDLNKAFGTYIADSCDYAILVGKKQTKPIQDGLSEKQFPDSKCYIATSIHDAFDHLATVVAQDDVVLIENDLPDTFNE